MSILRAARVSVLAAAVFAAFCLAGCPSPSPNVTVPNCVGRTQSAAESVVASAGLAVGSVTQQYSATVPAGNVISQDPGAGTNVPLNTAVNLVVSQGPTAGPTAAFTMNHSSGEAPLIVQFEDQSTPGTAPITSWLWAFNDPASGADNASAFQNPGHTFNAQGVYTVSLTVTTAHGSDAVT